MMGLEVEMVPGPINLGDWPRDVVCIKLSGVSITDSDVNGQLNALSP